MPAQHLGSMALAAVLLAGCARSSTSYPAQSGVGQLYPEQYAAPQGQYPAPPGPQYGPAAPQPMQARIIVTPVFYVPADVFLDPQTELYATSLIAAQMQLAQQRYQKILVVDTFQYAIEQPITYHSMLTTDQLYATQPDTAHTMARELLAWRGEDRNTSRHVFVAMIVRAPGRPCGKASRCMGGGRTFNGAPWLGGGFVQLEFANLLDGKHFQSTLVHEIGHGLGLSHSDCHGQSMSQGASIMSYNTAHWSSGLNESADPGTLTDEDVVTLARNVRAFPRLAADPSVAERARRPLVRVSGECYMIPMDSSIGPVRPGPFSAF